MPFTRSKYKSSFIEQQFSKQKWSQRSSGQPQEGLQRDSTRTDPSDGSEGSQAQGPTWSKRDSTSDREFYEAQNHPQPASDRGVNRPSTNRHPSRLSKTDQSFFKKLTVTNAPTGTTATNPDVAEALEVVDQFITKNRLTTFVDQAIYNVEDEEFVLKFDPTVLQNPEFFRKHHVMQQDGVVFRKFKLLPTHLFKEAEAERILQKGGLTRTTVDQ